MPVDGERLPTTSTAFITKQTGALCAVHALNNLVQARWFDEVGLAEVAATWTDECSVVESGRNHESQNVRGDGSSRSRSSSRPCSARASRADVGSTANRESGDAGNLNRRCHRFALRRIGERHWFDLEPMASDAAGIAAHVDLFLQAHFEGPATRSASAAPVHRLGSWPRPSPPVLPPARRPPSSTAGDAGLSARRALAPSEPEVDPALAAAAAADPELARPSPVHDDVRAG